MRTKMFIRSILVILIISLVACQASTAEPNITKATTEATQENILPSNTSTPTPIPLTLAFSSPDWKGTELDSVCVKVDEGQVDETNIDFLTSEYHQNKAELLLTEIGLKTTTDPSVCDATLNIVLGSSVSYTTYTETSGGSATVDCLTHVGFSGLMVLTDDKHSPLYTDLNGEAIEEPYTIVDQCSEIKIAADIAWTKAVLKGLNELMGSYMLTSLFKSQDTVHQTSALEDSEVLGPTDVAVLPDLVEALKTNPGDSSYIASGIQNMGLPAQEAAQEAVPTLIENLKTSYDDDVTRGFGLNVEFQQHIIEALGKLGPAAKEAVPLLIQILKDQNDVAAGLQDSVVQALGNIGPDAAEAVPELQKIVDVNSNVAEALRKIESVAPDIAVLMKDAKNYKEDPFDAPLAMETLGKLNAQSADILPFLISAAADSDPNVAANAIRELGKLGPVSPEIFPILEKALSSSNETVQQAGAAALGDFGPQAAEAIPLLITVIKKGGQYSLARSEAVNTLGRIGEASPEVISILIGELEKYTIGTESALEQLGPEARPAVPALIKGLEGENVNPYLYDTQIPYVRALIAITGEYHGFKATDWQAWWDAQPK